MTEKYNIPKENSLDSLEGIESYNTENKKTEISQEMWRRFISNYESFMNLEDFHMHAKFTEPSFTDLGYPELGKKWAYAYLKKQIDSHLSENLGVSHTLNKAYEVLVYAENIDNEVKRKLGEMLGKLYEAGGRFDLAYEYYRQNCRDKYKYKLDSVRMKIEKPEEVDEKDIWEYLPEGNQQADFPDFIKAPTQEERKIIETELFDEFMKAIPEAILQIDTKKEFAQLMEEAGKIIEKHTSGNQ